MKTEEFIAIEQQMHAAFHAGKFEVSGKLAMQYLEMAKENTQNWNYGNAIHKANIILGRISLNENQPEKAKTYLKEAGKTPGSPQLNSFGPNMSLAKALLEVGERDAVIEFIEQSKKYWKWFFSWRKIRTWKKEIHKGRIPNFGANLNY